MLLSSRGNMVNRIIAFELTPAAVHLSVLFMGDKSPKATSKQAAQKQAKVAAANQKKKDAASAKQVPKK
jgi:multisubunit Na+/H+ antiporter MnhC subunit